LGIVAYNFACWLPLELRQNPSDVWLDFSFELSLQSSIVVILPDYAMHSSSITR